MVQKQRRKTRRASSRSPRRRTQPITAVNGRQLWCTSQDPRKTTSPKQDFSCYHACFPQYSSKVKSYKKSRRVSTGRHRYFIDAKTASTRRLLAPSCPPVAHRSSLTSCGLVATSSRRLIPYLPRRARVAYCHHTSLRRSYSAAPPRSPVRIRTTSSTGETKILPSPTLPVRHVSTITSIKRSV